MNLDSRVTSHKQHRGHGVRENVFVCECMRQHSMRHRWWGSGDGGVAWHGVVDWDDGGGVAGVVD